MTKREFEKLVSQAIGNNAGSMSLAQITQIPDRTDFIIAVSDYVAPPGSLIGPWEILLTLEENPRTVLVLSCLTAALDTDGAWKFMSESRELLEEAVASSKRIGAARAVEYLESIRTAFPGKVLPGSTEECVDLMLEDKQINTRLNEVDRRYPDVYSEIIDCLRAYMVERLDAVWTASA